MKPYQIAVFIVVTMAVVVLLAFVYPKKGIDVGGVTLKFADAEEVLAPDEEPVYDASGDADKIRRYIAAQQMNEDMKRRYAVLNRPGAIAFPGDMPEWMDGVFAALDNARKEPVRILHYGDSQIEEDRITGRMRTDIQELFGGYGAGMVPAYQSVPTSAVGQKCDVELPRSLVYGTPEQKHPQRNYGPSGQMATLDGTVIYCGFDPNHGNVIEVQHKNGFVSVYKHNELLLKEVGDHVVAGEAIALVGNTGNLSTGPHLHFELWYKGSPVNPEEYIAF